MLAYAPELRAAFLAFYQAVWRSDVVPPETMELMRVRAARKIDCFF
jgi:hypothetical protein